MKKNDSFKIVLHARHLNSHTNRSSKSWPLELVGKQLARANEKHKSAIDLLYAYAHATLDDETIKSTRFLSGVKLFAFNRGFYGLKVLPFFFTQQMSLLSENVIRRGSALIFFDDTLPKSNSKPHILQPFKQFYHIAKKEKLR